MIRVAICDDDRTILDGLSKLVRADEELELVAAVETAEEALRCSASVDVWLLDVRLPDGSGLQVASRIRHHPATQPRVLLMTAFDTEDVILALGRGVDGFIHKGAEMMSITTAIRAVHAGFQVGNRAVTRALATHIDRLSIVDPDRSAQLCRDRTDERILEQVLGSRSIREIAESVHLSTSGVHKRLARIFRRAEVPNQRALVAWLHEH